MGPVITILLNRKIDFEEIQQVDDFLKSVEKAAIKIPKSIKSIRNFWVDKEKLPKLNNSGSDCGFSLQFDNKLKFVEEDEVLEIEMALNFKVQSQIILSAGCNQQGDHYVLGELALSIARMLNGLIDFEGDLNTCLKGIEEIIEGRVYAIEYNDGMAKYQIADAEFLENWIKHEYFRLIK